MPERIVIALGGNALQRKGEATADAQERVARETASRLASLIVAGHPVHDVHIKGFFHHDGRCGIIEVKSFAAAETFYAVRKSAVCQRTGRDNHDPFFRYFPDFFIDKFNQRMTFYLF
jgi:hypothetical protein